MTNQPAVPRLAVLVFTDVVKSVPLKSKMGDAAAAAIMSRHDRIFHASFAAIPSAKVLQDTGDGFLLRFETASDAVAFALRLQHAISREDWQGQAIAVRVGIHLGEVWEVDSLEKGFEKLFGLTVDMTARVMSVALGGQILMTRSVFDSARQNIRQHPDAESLLLRWMAHGPYRFSGSDEPTEICEVGVEGVSPLHVPPDTEKARRALGAGEEVMFGWRPGIGLEIPDRPGWQIERKIGTGGFGEVWLASNRKLKQQRVFKFCFDADRLRSLKRELTLFRVLREVLGDRPDIARLQGINLDRPPFFLESDYTPGGDLSEWATARGGIATVPLAQRLQLFARAADAVAAAHSVGVLHKDIKPSNILIYVDEEGVARPRLCDFGIGMIDDVAKLQGGNITITGFTQITTDGSGRSGTPIYAPPELLAGRPYTVKGDVYALGVLLYQLVVADLDRPLAAGWERDVADPLLRQDIAESVDGDPQRRPASAEDLSRRITSLETRRLAMTQAEKTRKRVARMHLMQRLFVAVSICGIMLTSVVIYFNLRIATERDRAVAARTEKELERRDAVRLRREAEAQRQLTLKTLAELKETAPTFYARSQALTAEKKFDEALKNASYASSLDPENAVYAGKRAELLQTLFRFTEARDAYREALLIDPHDAAALKGVEISERLGDEAKDGGSPQHATLAELQTVMHGQGRYVEALVLLDRLDAEARAQEEPKKRRLEQCAKALAEARFDGRAIIEPDGLLCLHVNPNADSLDAAKGSPFESVMLTNQGHTTDLSPLAGMPLKKLDLSGNPIYNLHPLKGMALTDLIAGNSKINDLSPLQGMPLVHIIISGTHVSSLEPLRGAPLEMLDISDTDVTDLSPLMGMPLKTLVAGKLKATDLGALRGLPIRVLRIMNAKLRDIEPLRGMPLEELDLMGVAVADLSPLRGMRLRRFYVNAPIHDLSPLVGMPLETLDVKGMGMLRALNVVRGMPLRSLHLSSLDDVDLGPLHDLPLADLAVMNLFVADLGPLKGVPLTSLLLRDTDVADLSPLEGMPLNRLVITGCPYVRDVRPLLKCAKLEILRLPEECQDIECLKSMPSLKYLSYDSPGVGSETSQTVAVFWKKYDPAKPPLTPAQVRDHVLQRDLSRYNKRLADAHAGVGIRRNGDAFEITRTEPHEFGDLSALHGIPLSRVDIRACKITDLSPFAGMPITSLRVSATPVADLRPLADMPLTELVCDNTQVRDLTPLHGLPLVKLDLHNTPVSDLGPLQGAPLADLEIGNALVKDLSPLHGMPLKRLMMYGCRAVDDISALEGAPLEELDIGGSKVHDIGALHGMKLRSLCLSSTEVSDIRALAGMPLVELFAFSTKIADLTPLRGLPLKYLDLEVLPTSRLQPSLGAMAELANLERLKIAAPDINDVTPLQSLPLKEMLLKSDALADLSPLRHSSIETLGLRSTKVTDLTPLQDMPRLNALSLDCPNVRDLRPLLKCQKLEWLAVNKEYKDIDVLRAMASLRYLSYHGPMDDARGPSATTVEQFWKEYDRKKTGGRDAGGH